jgi:hypothetical protein
MRKRIQAAATKRPGGFFFSFALFAPPVRASKERVLTNSPRLFDTEFFLCAEQARLEFGSNFYTANRLLSMSAWRVHEVSAD